jgi:hypothetical protein
MVLIATVPAALALTFADGLVHQSGLWSAALMAFLGSASLQIGYLFGLIIRCMMVGDVRRRAPAVQPQLVNRSPQEYKSNRT